MIPGWWVGLVIGLGAFRVVRLIGWDDLPPIARLRVRITGERARSMPTESTQPIYVYRRPLLAHFISCPYCVGWWVALASYGSWLLWPRGTLYVLAPFALSAFVGLVARNLDP